jgi:hypothetical protein
MKQVHFQRGMGQLQRRRMRGVIGWEGILLWTRGQRHIGFHMFTLVFDCVLTRPAFPKHLKNLLEN